VREFAELLDGLEGGVPRAEAYTRWPGAVPLAAHASQVASTIGAVRPPAELVHRIAAAIEAEPALRADPSPRAETRFPWQNRALAGAIIALAALGVFAWLVARSAIDRSPSPGVDPRSMLPVPGIASTRLPAGVDSARNASVPPEREANPPLDITADDKAGRGSDSTAGAADAAALMQLPVAPPGSRTPTADTPTAAPPPTSTALRSPSARPAEEPSPTAMPSASATPPETAFPTAESPTATTPATATATASATASATATARATETSTATATPEPILDGRLTGRVFYEGGDPVSGVRVEVRRVTNPGEGPPHELLPDSTAETNADGEFGFLLAPGWYVVGSVGEPPRYWWRGEDDPTLAEALAVRSGEVNDTPRFELERPSETPTSEARAAHRR